LAPPKILAWLR